MTAAIDPGLRSCVLALLPGADWRLTPLATGHNLVLRARGGGADLVVRLQPQARMSSETAETLVAWLRVLATDPDLRTPRPVRLATGAWTEALEHAGRRLRCHVVTWVGGDRASDARAFVEPSRLRAIGETVARLHGHASRLPAERSDGVRRVADVLARDALASEALRAALPRELHAQLARAYERLAALLAAHDAVGEAGLIHADLEPQNWVFEEGRPGVIDFDEVRRGPFAADLHGVLWTHATWKDLPRFRADLFAGYERVRPLPPGTREQTDAWMALAFAAWIAFLFRERSEEEQARHLEGLQPLVERIVRWCGAG